MVRGEVRWHRFAAPDRRRPVLILTRDSVIPSLGEVTVAPVTTHTRDIPSEVALSRGDGMPRDCAVNCDHLQTVPARAIGRNDHAALRREDDERGCGRALCS